MTWLRWHIDLARYLRRMTSLYIRAGMVWNITASPESKGMDQVHEVEEKIKNSVLRYEFASLEREKDRLAEEAPWPWG